MIRTNLVTMKNILEIAEEKKIAVGAFEFWSYEVARAIIHAAEKADIPVILQCGILEINRMGGFKGAVETETVFAWPGVGRLVINAITQRDFPLVQGGVLMMALIFTLVNLLVDVCYAFVNPRIRYE